MRPLSVYWLAVCIMLPGCLSIDTFEQRMARWEAFKAEWEAKGFDFDAKKLIPPEVPSEENFAHTPLLKPLYDVEWNADFSKVIEERDLEGRQRTGQFLQRLKLSDKAKEQYGNKSWIGGEAVDLEAWQQTFRDHEEWPNPVTRGDPAEDILLALKKYDSGLVELENAVRDRPFSRFGIEYRAQFFS